MKNSISCAINRVINKHLREHELQYSFRDRLSLWHWGRTAHNATPIFWLLKYVWWIPGFRWLYQLRCRNVSWRMKRRERRVVAQLPDLYDWSRT